MMLRSSSTPVLGSLVSSSSESPNNYHHHYHHSEVAHTTPQRESTSIHQSCSNSKLSYKQHASFCSSSPISPSISEISGSSLPGFRRAQSDGNLEGLLVCASTNNVVDEFTFSNNPSKKFARKRHCSTLEAIPSFSFYKLNSRQEEEFNNDREEEEKLGENTTKPFDGSLQRMENVGLKEGDRRCINAYTNVGFEEDREEMHLAKGLGIYDAGFVVCTGGHSGGNGGGHGGGHGCRPVAFDGSGGDSHGIGIEEHYKRLLEENPSNPLCLRNYAQFLYQTKGNLKSAEEYYSRAILADPKDGEVLSQYANLVWELYRNKDRATDYFERAIIASTEDSHVHGAYARFLWETEDDENDQDESYKS